MRQAIITAATAVAVAACSTVDDESAGRGAPRDSPTASTPTVLPDLNAFGHVDELPTRTPTSRADAEAMGMTGVVEQGFLETVRRTGLDVLVVATDDELVAAGHAACDAMDADLDSVVVLTAASVGQGGIDEAAVVAGAAGGTLCPEHADYLATHPLERP